MRQEVPYVNEDLFHSLQCNRGNFREKYGENVQSLTALCEASQLLIKGEDGLNIARYLSRELLHAWLSRHQDHSEAMYVAIRVLKAKSDWTCLRELDNINSSIVRFMTQNEIIQVPKWCGDHGIANMLQFTNPSFSDQRFEFTKIISLIYIIDDIFDVHGTKNLPNMDMFHNTLKDMLGKLPGNVSNKIGRTMSRKFTSDPCVSISISNTNTVVGRTIVLSNNEIPVWQQHFYIPVVHHATELLFFVQHSDVVCSQLICFTNSCGPNILRGTRTRDIFQV